MGCGRLVIFTWGNPATWRTYRYRAGFGRGVEVESCTTFVPVLNEFSGASKKTKVFLVVLDSLVDWRGEVAGESECSRCYSECRSRVDLSGVSGYADLLRVNEDLVFCMLKCLGVERDVSVIVGPALGSPGGVWYFGGEHSSTDFMSLVLYELGREVLSECYDEIVVDLSHGVNFMPSEVMVLAQMLASLSLLRHNVEKVFVRALNSDPVSGGLKGLLNINTIYENTFTTIVLPEFPKRLMREKDKKFEGLRRAVSDVMRRVKNIIKSIYYPLPLVLVELCKSYENVDLLGSLNMVVNEWVKETKIDVSSKSVVHSFGIDPRAIYYVLLAFSACSMASKLSPTSENLEELARHVYRDVSKSYYYLIVHEVSQVNILKDSGRRGGCVLLSEFHDKSARDEPNLRVLIAHAGLQKELVEVCFEEGVSLRYSAGAVEKILSSFELP